MRKLLILALIAVAALVVMGLTYNHYSRGYVGSNGGIHWRGSNRTFGGEVILEVYQWADATITYTPNFEIANYDESFDGLDIGNFYLSSNGPVLVTVQGKAYKYTGTKWCSMENDDLVDLGQNIRRFALWIDFDENGSWEGNDAYWALHNDKSQVIVTSSYVNNSGVKKYDIYLTLSVKKNFPAGAYKLAFAITLAPTVRLP